MAEFCLDCWNKINHTRLQKEDVTLTDYLDFCEECAQAKPVIITIGKARKGLFDTLLDFFLTR